MKTETCIVTSNLGLVRKYAGQFSRSFGREFERVVKLGVKCNDNSK